jgi:GAF domain-containing protein
MLRETLLARTLVELSDTLVQDFDVVDRLTLLTERCVEALEVSAAGILLAAIDSELRVVASSSNAVHIVETFELQSEEGPCLDCYRSGEAVLNQNLLTGGDNRWPRFAPLAIESGFCSVNALPLHLREQTIGALNLFSANEGQFSEADALVAQAFADVATIAILQNRQTLKSAVINEQLSYALHSRITIEQAKGHLSERLGLESEESFRLLRDYSQNHNVRLKVVAQGVVTGDLKPEEFIRRPLQTD